MAKTIGLATTLNGTYTTLPGSSGDLNYEGSSADTTIFGQKYKSSQATLLGWTASANAYIKGGSGYKTKVYYSKVGSRTALAGGAGGGVISKTTGKVIDMSSLVFVGTNPVVSEVNPFTGNYTLVSGTVTGVTGYEFDMTDELTAIRDFSLTMSAEAVETTDFGTAQGNDGFKTYIPGLKTVSAEASGFFDSTDTIDFKALVVDRKDTVLKIDILGDGSTAVFYGYFKAISTGQSGDVGGNEDETISFELSVPDFVTGSVVPFTYVAGGSLNAAIEIALDAFVNDTSTYVRYLHDGAKGWKGNAVITDCSLSTSLDGVNEFSISLQGSNSLTPIV